MGIFSAIMDRLRNRQEHSQARQPSGIPGSESSIGGVGSAAEQAQPQSGSAQRMQARNQAGVQAGAQAGVPPTSSERMHERNQAGAQAGMQAGVEPASQAPGSQPLQGVDVQAVLAQLQAQKGASGNYRQSIVDLLKLLDLDSSLAARTQLAEELEVRAGAHGSAEQNMALHKAVMRKLAENGGKVPASLRD